MKQVGCLRSACQSGQVFGQIYYFGINIIWSHFRTFHRTLSCHDAFPTHDLFLSHINYRYLLTWCRRAAAPWAASGENTCLSLVLKQLWTISPCDDYTAVTLSITHPYDAFCAQDEGPGPQKENGAEARRVTRDSNILQLCFRAF